MSGPLVCDLLMPAVPELLAAQGISMPAGIAAGNSDADCATAADADYAAAAAGGSAAGMSQDGQDAPQWCALTENNMPAEQAVPHHMCCL